MQKFRIACQTITFGDDQNKRFPEIFSSISNSGYKGVEIGYRHIQPIIPEKLKNMLEDVGLTLLGTHLGGNLEDPGQAEGEQKMLDEVIDYLNVAGGNLIMYSGLKYENEEQFQKDFKMLNRAAIKCSENNMRLLYHNHNWEFEDNARIVNALLNEADNSLGFCPDIGWVMKGGWNPVQYLEKAGKRVEALHFKDFASNSDGIDTVCLGEGVVPLREAAEWAKNNMSGGWMIAEQDNTNLEPADAVKQNANFLNELF